MNDATKEPANHLIIDRRQLLAAGVTAHGSQIVGR